MATTVRTMRKADFVSSCQQNGPTGTRGTRLYLAEEALTGLLFMHRCRFLTIAQFARISGFSLPHSREVLRNLLARGALGYTGYFPLPGTGGRAPKVYFLKRKGFSYLSEEGGLDPQDLGEFRE